MSFGMVLFYMLPKCMTQRAQVQKKNLSVQQLLGASFIDDYDNPKKLEHQIDEASRASTACVNWRNKMLAHCDLDIAMGNKILRPISMKEASVALQALSKILDLLSGHYMHSQSAFELLVTPKWVNLLLSTLQVGISSKKSGCTISGLENMSNSIISDQSLEECVQKMGAELGKVYYCLRQELVRLYEKWNEYMVLYGTTPDIVDLLNKSSPGFFSLVERVFLRDIILHISRMSDPASTGTGKNLSVQQLLDRKIVKDSSLHNDLEHQIDKVKKASESFRFWRNKTLAHNDLILALDADKASLIPGISRTNVIKMLHTLSATMDLVSRRYMGRSSDLDAGTNSDGAKSLLLVLQAGVWERGAHRERVRTGKAMPEDYQSPWV